MLERCIREGGFAALDKLSDEEKKWIAPLPVPFDSELPQYKKYVDHDGQPRNA